MGGYHVIKETPAFNASPDDMSEMGHGMQETVASCVLVGKWGIAGY